jgi:hypothetical protein
MVIEYPFFLTAVTVPDERSVVIPTAFERYAYCGRRVHRAPAAIANFRSEGRIVGWPIRPPQMKPGRINIILQGTIAG